ncbi:MAG: hypothetical protein CR991_03120 [Proteobacteria bacterium]|nr:MAG: hypothetical protein CR991_03120 [Pseudomonadota bacterium]
MILSRLMLSKNVSKGMTLIEMLVTLVLFSLLSSLVFTGLTFVKQAQEAVTEASQRQRYASLQQHALYSLLQGMQVTADTEPEQVSGSSQHWQAVSFQALMQPAGQAKAFRLQLQQQAAQTYLFYQTEQATQTTQADSVVPNPVTLNDADEAPSAWLLGQWSSAQAVHFQFLDWQGQWQTDWQVAAQSALIKRLRLGEKTPAQSPWLPRAICLCTNKAPLLLVALQQRAAPRADFLNIEALESGDIF